ncbi:MAG: type II secretion system protein N [Burkholderiales bacterium]|nr:type II secretion system protein N [Burkholderiales bacterium]
MGILVFISIVFMCTNFFWWMSKPAKLNVLHNVLPEDFNNKVSQNIINRAPFGIVTKKVDNSVEAKSSDNIVLSGIYAADKNNSIAFINLNGTSMIAKIGDTVGSSVLVNILPDQIVLSSEGSERSISMSAGNGEKNDVPVQDHSQSNNHGGNSYQDTSQNQMSNNNNSQQNNSSAQSGTTEDIVAQRKKMLEQFQKQNSDND